MSKSKKRHAGCLRRIFLIVFMMMTLAGTQRAMAVTATEKEVFRFFTDECGYSPAAACGIMGNIKAESDFHAAINGMGGAYGLCQWGGVRITRLKRYCADHGYNYASLNGQLHFIHYEVQTYFPKVYSYLKGVSNTATGAYNAGYYWCMYYEIPANGASAAAYRARIGRDTFWKGIGASKPYLTVKAASKDITLKWSGKGKGNALVMRSTKKDGTYTQIASLSNSQTSYTDKTTKTRTKYYYYVTWGSTKADAVHTNKASVSRKQTLSDSEITITLSKDVYTYNGKAKKPGVTIYNGQSKLKKGRDYTVTYQKNVNAGTATAVIKGKGNYSGSVKKKFKIEKASWKITAKAQKASLKAKTYTVKYKVATLSSKAASGKLQLTSSDPSVAKVSGKKLKLRSKGVTTITVTIKKDKNHQKTTKDFKLTVQ